ncbi:MAG: hypothetical protein ACPKM0_01085 [Pleomorphochaeta sp.]
MSWYSGNQITASKLNSENNLKQTGYISIGNNSTKVLSLVKYIHKPVSSSTVIARYDCHSLDGWFNNGSEHEIAILPLSSSSGYSFSTGAHPVSSSGRSYCYRQYHTHHHDIVNKNITGASIPHSGWYQFVISQNNRVGGEAIWLKTYSYPMKAVKGHQIVEYSSSGNRITGNQLTASKLNGHYITTL